MLAFVLPLSAAAPALAWDGQPTVSVNGEVVLPTTYTVTQLAAVTQTTVSVTQAVEGHSRVTSYTGVLLETLVDTAMPDYPSTLLNAKNGVLRVTVSVAGASDHTVTFALGELDPRFGNHPALLALARNGHPLRGSPDLVVPDDALSARWEAGVNDITVGIATAPATTTVTGALTVIAGRRHTTLSLTQLSALPQRTLTVSFEGAEGVQTHTETGPTLNAVLRAAHVHPTLNTWVAGVGNDNYLATVTPGEAWVGGCPLLVSLIEDGKPVDGMRQQHATTRPRR